MRKICFIILILVLFSACAEENLFYTAENRSWYHADQSCRFGEFSKETAAFETEFFAFALSDTDISLRPCPACARDWKPVFSGETPEWPHEIAPWQLGGTPEMRLPYETLKDYGDLSEWMYEAYKDGPYPDWYAGLYRNASGGYTLMLVNPTPNLIQEIRILTGTEFWTLAADYDWNTLAALQSAMVEMMNGAFGIHSVGISVDENCVIVGVDDDTGEICNAIRSAAAQMGFDSNAVLIHKQERAEFFSDFS